MPSTQISHTAKTTHTHTQRKAASYTVYFQIVHTTGKHVYTHTPLLGLAVQAYLLLLVYHYSSHYTHSQSPANGPNCSRLLGQAAIVHPCPGCGSNTHQSQGLALCKHMTHSLPLSHLFDKPLSAHYHNQVKPWGGFKGTLFSERLVPMQPEIAH